MASVEDVYVQTVPVMSSRITDTIYYSQSNGSQVRLGPKFSDPERMLQYGPPPPQYLPPLDLDLHHLPSSGRGSPSDQNQPL